MVLGPDAAGRPGRARSIAAIEWIGRGVESSAALTLLVERLERDRVSARRRPAGSNRPRASEFSSKRPDPESAPIP
jgi:hypothetical protein